MSDGEKADMGHAQLLESFTGGMLSVLARDQSNVIFSPYVIAAALNVLRLGSRGSTEAELSRALRPAPRELLYNEPIRQDYSATYISSNRVWIQTGVHVNDEFLVAVRQQESAILQYLDFMNSPESARSTINHTIAREMRGIITDLVPRSAVRQETRLALTNVIYYKGLWSNPFPKRNTRSQLFYSNGYGKPGIPIPMMRHTLRADYLSSNEYEAALLSYRDSALSFGIILPTESLEDLRSRVSSGGIHKLLSDVTPCELTIDLPKLRIESSLELAPVLAPLGIRSAFGSAADFSGISSSESVRINFMTHSAYIEVDEEGTEAAAAVATGFTPISRRSAEMIVDRPFIFAIIDIESGITYFLGQVTYPARSVHLQ